MFINKLSLGLVSILTLLALLWAGCTQSAPSPVLSPAAPSPPSQPAYSTSTSLPPPSATALILATTSLPDGTIGQSYSQSGQVSGGSSPYTWSITSGTLPSGLLLNASTGTISGSPTTSGISTFTLQVTTATVLLPANLCPLLL